MMTAEHQPAPAITVLSVTPPAWWAGTFGHAMASNGFSYYAENYDIKLTIVVMLAFKNVYGGNRLKCQKVQEIFSFIVLGSYCELHHRLPDLYPSLPRYTLPSPGLVSGLCPNSSTSTCCGFVGLQVVQQAVQHLDMLGCCWICCRPSIWYGLVSYNFIVQFYLSSGLAVIFDLLWINRTARCTACYVQRNCSKDWVWIFRLDHMMLLWSCRYSNAYSQF